MQQKPKTLVVLLGPTAVGKTALSLRVAERYATSIVNADSRQIYRDMPICTAAPTAAELAAVRHYFVGTHALSETFSAAQFEVEALRAIDGELNGAAGDAKQVVVMSGGSMMYLDAVMKGIDDMPNADPQIRADLRRQYEAEGLEPLLARLRLLDPAYYARVDRRNPQRVLHGVEMCLTTGRPFSSFHTGEPKPRPFRIVRIGLRRERTELYGRIERRVDQMLAGGLIDEARRVADLIAPLQATLGQPLNSVQTVGMKEMLAFLEGRCSLDEARQQIIHATKVYSKKQMTWFQHDAEINWFHPDQEKEIMAFLASAI